MRYTEKRIKYIKELKTNGTLYLVDDILSDNFKLTSKSIRKLGQLEDIEEELGIDLITLFKALKNGIIYKTPLGNQWAYTTLTPDRLSIEYKWNCLRKGTQKFYFKDYGKTWALDKEDLTSE